MMLELSDLQKRVEVLEKLTNQLAQWVGFSIGEGGDELLKGNQVKAEVVDKDAKGKGGGSQGRGRKGVRALGNKSTLKSKRKSDDVPPAEEAEKVDTSSDEYSDKDDAFADPDFDVDADTEFPMIVPTSGGIKKEEEEEEYFDEDFDDDDYCPPPPSTSKCRSRRSSTRSSKQPCSSPLPRGRKRKQPEPFVRLEKIPPSTSTLKDSVPEETKNVNSFKCEKCPEIVFQSLRKRIQHVKEVHKRERKGPMLCPHCPEDKRKPFSRPWQLEAHILKHTGETPFLCQVCGKGFRSNRLLLQHISINHNPREPFSCDKCGKTFTSKSGFSKHILIAHTENGRSRLSAQCEKCFIVFADKSKLKRHMEDIHGDKRQLSCEICGQLFKRPAVLQKHLKRHNNPSRRKRGPQLPKPRGKPVPPVEPKNNNNDRDIPNQSESLEAHSTPSCQPPSMPIPEKVVTGESTVEASNIKQEEGNRTTVPTTSDATVVGEFNIEMLQC